MDNFGEILTSTTVVIDQGSGVIKAGKYGKDKPQLQFNTYVGTPKYPVVLPNPQQKDIHVGNIPDESRGLLKLNYPIKNGMIQDWDQMDHIYKYIFKELKVNPKETPLLIT